MKKFVLLGLALVVLVAGATVAAASHTQKIDAPVTVKVIEHAATDIVIDTGKPGDTTGDLLTWHNSVYDAANASKVGHDQGDCIRISPTGGTWECRWTTWIPGGSVTVEGPFYDTRDNTIAVTGGTGVFANARGTMDLVARKGGTEYAFIFNLIP